RYGSEHDQRECGVRDGVEDIERLERAELLCECDDEAGYGRAGADTEVAGDAVKSEGGRSLLALDQSDRQCPVGRVCRPDSGSADNRAGEGLPGTLYVGEAGEAQGARQESCDQDRFGGVAVEQSSRRRRGDRGHPHGRRENQSGYRRWKATYLVQIDDFKRENEPVTEVIEGVSRLKDEHRAREPGAPTRDEA